MIDIMFLWYWLKYTVVLALGLGVVLLAVVAITGQWARGKAGKRGENEL